MKNHDTFEFEQEEKINVREILFNYLRHWKLFLFFVTISLSLALVYLRFSTPIYESKATILVNDEENGMANTELSLFNDMGLLGGAANVKNEIEVLNSRKLMEDVVKTLGLQKAFYLVGDKSGLQRGEIMEKIPVDVQLLSADSLLYESTLKLEIEFLDSEHFAIDGDGLKSNKKFGEVLYTKSSKLRIMKTADFSSKWLGKKVVFNFITLENSVNTLLNGMTIESVDKDANVISIGITGPNYKKNNAIIDELIRQHQIDAIQDKNQVAQNTSLFINERMKLITAELSSVENESEQYKNKYKLVDIGANTSQFMQKEEVADAAISDANIQLSLSSFMIEFMKKLTGNTELLPSNLGFADRSIVEMTHQYNELMLKKNRLLENSSKKNPAIERIDGQLAGLKTSLVTSLKNNKEAINLELKTLERKQNGYESKLAEIPKYEREFRDIQRQQQIKETLYLYLMEKREENEIRLAATIDNTKVIDYAYCNRSPISPNKKNIYLMSFLFGLLVPFSIIYIRKLLDNKVHSLKDLEKFDLQGIGEIPLHQGEQKIVATEDSRSLISESFRLLRTNINFLLDQNTTSKVIAITSTIAGEGKTFTSINLAYTLSHSGKKTVLVGLDLRAPKLKKYLNLESELGATNYIVENNLTVKDILIPVEDNPLLYCILSGSIPPNPAELLLRNRLSVLIKELREQFDYIIIDTAPIGIVSDTLNISIHCDLILYIARAEKLDKRWLQLPKKLLIEKKVPKLAVIVNGIKNDNKGYGYGYDYGYGYGYGYGEENAAYYGEASPKIRGWRKIIYRWIKKK